jgi:hypothetical protein
MKENNSAAIHNQYIDLNSSGKINHLDTDKMNKFKKNKKGN